MTIGPNASEVKRPAEREFRRDPAAGGESNRQMFFLRKIAGAVLGIMGAPILFVACTLLYVTGGREKTAIYLHPNFFIEMHPRTFLALGAGVAMLVASWWLLRDPKRRRA